MQMNDAMRACMDCGTPRTSEEIFWYGGINGGRCEVCEGAWSDRIDRWRRGETKEPELDSMFAGPKWRCPWNNT